MVDEVNDPDHYRVGGIDAWEAIRSKLTPEEWHGYLKGNILKYIMRCSYKGTHDVDIRKAKWYLDRLVEDL